MLYVNIKSKAKHKCNVAEGGIRIFNSNVLMKNNMKAAVVCSNSS